MVNEILSAIFGKKYKEAAFRKPPAPPYAVYFDDVDIGGSDDLKVCIITHEVQVEVYSIEPEKEIEKKLENELITRGIEYHKASRQWITEEQMYMVLYEFTYTQKEE